MSVDPSKSMNDVWAKFEGHVVNDVFPLRRFIGSSDHSGVFLTTSAKQAPAEVVLKLIAAVPTLAESQLSLWLTAADLAHPHLIPVFEAGRCHIDGLPYLYAVMEYADQDLAQLLQRRALTEDETREMLVPTLRALAFLHERRFVQGHLKPSNILVVADQLKLASETIRPVSDVTDGTNALSGYEASEARDGAASTASDIWDLGMTMCEALTRSQPAGLQGAGDVLLPADLPPSFREIVARCLSRRAEDRPTVAALEAWVHGKPAAPAPGVFAPPAAAPVPIPTRPAVRELPRLQAAIKPVQRPVVHAEVNRGTSDEQPATRRAFPLIIGAVAVVALGWVGVRMLSSNPPATPPAAEVVPETPTSPAAHTVQASPAPPVAAVVRKPAAQVQAAPAVRPPPGAEMSAVHEVIPDVSRSARRTIRGTIRVSVQVIIGKDGTVFAALADDPGPSPYFERRAIEAAKKWTFSPAETEAQRVKLLRFNFTRDGTTARAVAR